MSRRASNSVKLARVAAARIGTKLDRNGFPVLDDPRHANRLPKKCHERMHFFVVTSRTHQRFSILTGDEILSIEKRCVQCGERFVETVVAD